ncbi:hypothetical protein DYI95_003040 [Thermaerobacter sp. PB12/4term]|uniref:hypothetical protein n=1 Tax=Thermaerobacter sp. PB12/4term TaxID=2293838 RepID=UPI0011C06EEF|nr:hypothetical protein [Thermaerobacter sp. PB12/4term]QIA26636.1 hypothetical protein DYI95_003040 [Thermaerobacter sp. PB12/4term]
MERLLLTIMRRVHTPIYSYWRYVVPAFTRRTHNFPAFLRKLFHDEYVSNTYAFINGLLTGLGVSLAATLVLIVSLPFYTFSAIRLFLTLFLTLGAISLALFEFGWLFESANKRVQTIYYRISVHTENVLLVRKNVLAFKFGILSFATTIVGALLTLFSSAIVDLLRKSYLFSPIDIVSNEILALIVNVLYYASLLAWFYIIFEFPFIRPLINKWLEMRCIDARLNR